MIALAGLGGSAVAGPGRFAVLVQPAGPAALPAGTAGVSASGWGVPADGELSALAPLSAPEVLEALSPVPAPAEDRSEAAPAESEEGVDLGLAPGEAAASSPEIRISAAAQVGSAAARPERSGAVFDGAGAKHEVLQLSVLDTVGLDEVQKSRARGFHAAAHAVAGLYQEAPRIQFRKHALSNAKTVLQLWWQSVRHGDRRSRLAAFSPVTLVVMLAGVLGNTPVEAARFERNRLAEVVASGHGIGAAAFPLLPVASWLINKSVEKGANKPAHELAHAIQYLTLGLALERGVFESPAEVLAAQNDIRWSYLWGGHTETAAIEAERTGRLDAVFSTLRKRGAQVLRSRRDQTAAAIQASVVRLHQLVSEVESRLAEAWPELLDGSVRSRGPPGKP